MSTANCGEDEEWELVNDDGFVYKRHKRPRLNLSTSTAAVPPPDPAVEEKNRRERKKRALLKLKTRYQQEIDRWEHMSNTLYAMQEKAQNQRTTSLSDQPEIISPLLPEQLVDSTCQRLVDDLLAQTEAQEAIILDISKLCDVADALCNAQEERQKQSFFDLPIWEVSPRELITSLCEDEE